MYYDNVAIAEHHNPFRQAEWVELDMVNWNTYKVFCSRHWSMKLYVFPIIIIIIIIIISFIYLLVIIIWIYGI
jgi:hypothetical protein